MAGLGSKRMRIQARPPIRSGLTRVTCVASRLLSRVCAGHAWLCLGGNLDGCWGRPVAAMKRAIAAIEEQGLEIIAQSDVFETPPVGTVRQPKFANMVVAVKGSVSPAQLLRMVKRIERAAGRRSGLRWGPRPLDIDLLDYAGRQINVGDTKREAGRLVLPHPEMHRRGFVLVPLAHVAPQWRHPVLGLSARSLIARRPILARGIRVAIDPEGS